MQEIAARYLESGRLAAHIESIRAQYRVRRDALVAALQASLGGVLSYDVPQGGMFLWARFNDATDTRCLLARARGEGVIFVPGDAFFASDPDRSTLRLNFTGADSSRLREGAMRLARAHAALAKVDLRSDTVPPMKQLHAPA